jgi:thiol reductant ABC exporter CydC subunit
LNTVRQTDQIIVLEQGRVVQAGRHAALIQQPGLYQRMVSASLAPLPHPSPFVSPSPPQVGVNPGLARGKEDEENSRSQPSHPTPPIPNYVLGYRSPALLRLLGLAAPFTGWIALSALMGFATIASNIGLMSASAYIISAAALHPSIAALQVAIVGVRFFGITRGVFRYLERYLSHQTTFRLLGRLRTWFYQALEPLAPARLMGYRSGDLLARILSDIESLENFYVRCLAPPLVAILVTLAVCALMARFDHRLALILLAFLVTAGAGLPILIRQLSRNAGRQSVEQRAALNAALVDGIQGMADLIAFDQGEGLSQQIRANSQALASTERHTANILGIQAALGSLLANLGMWAVLFLVIPLVSTGQVQGVYLAVLVLAALASFEAVTPLPLAAQYLESNLQAARRLFEVVDTRPEVVEPAEPLLVPEDFGLEVSDLRFRYPPDALSPTPTGSTPQPGSPWVLDGLSFSLPPGKRLAIVGPSGAGKSTLVSLLLRFWDYEAGQILFAGRDLRQYGQDDLRNRFSVISQNTYLFSASVLDNLLIARPAASQAEVIQAAEGAQIHRVIQALPAGYQTWIGDQGQRLSGGERQRLAVARALLKNAPILILDEPTANLDPLTEVEVLQVLVSLVEGRTTLMITHRLVGMEAMDEILVLDQGRVVECGRHADLWEAGGPYRRMWDLQHQATW